MACFRLLHDDDDDDEKSLYSATPLVFNSPGGGVRARSLGTVSVKFYLDANGWPLAKVPNG